MRAGRAASRRPTPSSGTDVFVAALVALPVSFVLWNPWGLIGRHEIRLLVGFVALALALRAMVRRGAVRVPRHWWLGASFLVLVVLSTLSAGDWHTTLLGHADRHLGIIGWLALGVAVLAGVNADDSDRRWFRLALEIAGTVVAVFGLAQVVGLTITGDLGGDDRITSTFGSATYTGAALALAFPLLLDRVLIATASRVRAASMISSAAVVAALALTGSRGAWIGGVTGLALVLWHHRIAHRRLVLRLAGGATGLGILLVAASPAVRDRITSLLRPGEGTAGGRLVLWESGLRTAIDRPVLGWGPDRTRSALPTRLPRLFEAEYWDQTVPDRAHNAVLDIAIAVGIPAALLAVAVVIAALVARPSDGAAEPSDRYVWRIVVLAHLPHLWFNFVQLDVDLIVAVLIGFLLAPTAVEVRMPVLPRAVLSTIASAAVIAGAVFGTGLVAADTIAARGVDAEQSGDVESAATAYQRAVDWSFGDARYHELVARFERRVGDYRSAIAAADRAAAVHKEDPFYGELPALTRAEAAAVDPSHAVAALDLYSELIARWPYHGDYHTGVGVALANAGELQRAEASFRTAIELTPLSSEPYQNLAQLLLSTGRTDEARRILEQGVERSLAPQQLVDMLGALS